MTVFLHGRNSRTKPAELPQNSRRTPATQSAGVAKNAYRESAKLRTVSPVVTTPAKTPQTLSQGIGVSRRFAAVS